MIHLNGRPVPTSLFPNGESKIKLDDDEFPFVETRGINEVRLSYRSDLDIWLLKLLVDWLDDIYPGADRNLWIDYLPYSRQDRYTGGGTFSLRTVADLINDMDFAQVKIVEPHSDVSLALIRRSLPIWATSYIAKWRLGTNKYDTVVFPDAGAEKRYGEMDAFCDKQIIVGVKRRNSEGKIVDFKFAQRPIQLGSVLIVDDLCSYGGTFVRVAQELKRIERVPGAALDKISLLVAHCEPTVFLGDLIRGASSWIDQLYTTNSTGISSERSNVTVHPLEELFAL